MKRQRHPTAVRPDREGTLMQPLRFALLGLCLLLAIPSAGAQETLKYPLAAATACPAAVASIATCYSGSDDNGSILLAAVPHSWNGTLIVFAHGGPSVAPMNAAYNYPNLSKYNFGVERGFAWIASTYRREGYGVRMAASDTDAARRFFAQQIARPQRVLIHGASYGGLVTAKLLEIYGKNADGSLNYAGALVNSPIIAGSPRTYEFRVDLRAIYQYYCRNLPRPGEPDYPLWTGIPADSKMTLKDLEGLVDECTDVLKPAQARRPQQAKTLADILGVMRFGERLLVRHMQTAAFVFRDITQGMMGGRNPFSNIGVTYKGSHDDAALNRDVARFAADASAAADLKYDGEPTGTLPVPMIALHSINDPQVAVESQAAWRTTVQAAGNADRLVQGYTDENEHTGQSPAELASALDLLVQWIDKGQKPDPQALAARCEELLKSHAGPCRYRPTYEPRPFETIYYPRAASR